MKKQAKVEMLRETRAWWFEKGGAG